MRKKLKQHPSGRSGRAKTLSAKLCKLKSIRQTGWGGRQMRFPLKENYFKVSAESLLASNAFSISITYDALFGPE
ncbi:hypothetical protein EVAR_36578_1 [Eumeta japonica]|uniref:Uncharacterized protein n=1 Tax=Eumeta variegata TaxID=151549 RepID=A0A4C1XNA8_EUMVA|nr:hypothetical protein EVAR_36578_1 [Eumeta japonica]